MANVPLTSLEYPELYGALRLVAGYERTPFLFMVGNINGAKTRVVRAWDFVEGLTESLDAPSIKPRSETQFIAGPPDFTPTTRTQKVNSVQLHDYPLYISDIAVAAEFADVTNTQSMVDLSQPRPAFNPRQREMNKQLLQIATDYEEACLRGVYAQTTGKAVAANMGGFLDSAPFLSTNVVDLANAYIDKPKFNEGVRKLMNSGSPLQQPVLFCGSYNKQLISSIFGFAPMDRTIGGVNIRQVETDGGTFPIVFWPKLTTDILLLDLANVAPVVWPLLKGTLYYEELAKNGGAEQGHIVGLLGIDRGIEQDHLWFKNCKAT